MPLELGMQKPELIICSHPVIYSDEQGEYCHVCRARLGAVAAPDVQTDKNPGETETAPEASKKASKRGAKKAHETCIFSENAQVMNR